MEEHVPLAFSEWEDGEGDDAVFRPGCCCGWQGKPMDSIVHAARAAEDHARMRNEVDTSKHT